MSIVAVTGDVATTAAVALAAGWPADRDVVLVEADPTGGDLAAWFELAPTPSLSTAVTTVVEGTWTELERHTRLAANGLRVLTAPTRATEAHRAVAESARSVAGVLASPHHPAAIVDCGAIEHAGDSTYATNPFLASAAVTVVVHRQATQSARAAAVRVQRLAESLDDPRRGAAVAVLVVGAAPFGVAELEAAVDAARPGTVVAALPIDELSAAVIGGRSGVSARRLARLPLMRASRAAAGAICDLLDGQGGAAWRVAG